MSDGGVGFGDDHLGGDPGGRGVLPAGFADLPGGPELAAAIAAVDLVACNGFELEEYVKGTRRMVCWAESASLTGVNELTYACDGMPGDPAERSDTPDPMTSVVLEPLLGWTGYRAAQYVGMAAAVSRLPRVGEALAGGRLELNEVRIIIDRVTDAKPDLWGVIEDALFPKVLELRGGLLRAMVEAEVVRADPEAAAKRHREARTGRNVAIWPAVDGVADLAVRGLSADQAAEAYGYIDAIARAVKSSGDPRKLSQLRADVAYSLLAGAADIVDCSAPTVADNHTGKSQAQPKAAKDAADADSEHCQAAPGQAAQDEAEPDQSGQGEAGQCAAKNETPQVRTEPEQADPEQDEAEPDQSGQGEYEQGEHGHCGVHRFPDHDLHDSWCECGDCSPVPVATCTVCGGAATAGVSVHDTAAHLAADCGSAGATATECDVTGENVTGENLAGENVAGENVAGSSATGESAASATGPSAAGQIPRQNRPPDETADPPGPPDPPDPPPHNSTPPPPPWSSTQPSWGPIRTRAKIQLNMPLTTLMGLSTRPGELGGFGPIITEVAERLVANNLTNPEARFSVGVTHPVTGRLLHLHPLPARFLRGLQAELVHARDQRCVWTTCRRPATTCHLDHNTEYADGGETGVDNIAPLCPRHHKAKTERDWRLRQTGPGEHTLTDPFGRQYASRAPSLTDPADPVVPDPAPAAATTASARDDVPPF
ncbi:HNH endonuclease [Actinopolymorpha sp. NPDC004070]|uniref:HNH endonuclease signature motif containing protein n=1 Tax=Actinopolymorpha sp. NPDC004070 TaxID=3154548 RepID=UPI0033ACC1F4